jgi:hypothetical protein
MKEKIKQIIEGKDEYKALWDVGKAKDAGILEDITWPEIAEVFNKQYREDETCYYDSSAYRKKYRNYIDAYEQLFSKENFTEKQISDVNDAKKELYKAKKQFEDQRRECRKFWTAEARFDNLTNKLIESVNRMCEERPLEFEDYYSNNGKNEATLFFADWHYGMITDNIWNKYNTDICRQRVSKLVSKTIKYLQRHDIKTLHVLLLGDAAHGGIHNSARVASEEDVCDQLMHVSEIIAEAVNELSKYVAFVNVYATYGNHLRTIQNKNDSIHSDNMEKIIPWWLKQRLKDNDRINIIKSDYYEFIYLNVLGYNIVAAHGDLEKFKQFGPTVNTLFSKKYGVSIDYTISADKHHIEEFEQMGIESVLVRSLCGNDDYANNLRVYSAPGQTLMIFSKEEGRECTYNIKLN